MTKGSFYWYFGNRRAYFDALADYWCAHYALPLLHRYVEKGGDVRIRYWEFYKALITDMSHKFDAAVGNWAHNDAYARTVVREVDAKRIAHATETFRKIGFSPSEAILRAELFYHALVGYHTVQPAESGRTRIANARERYQLITRE